MKLYDAQWWSVIQMPISRENAFSIHSFFSQKIRKIVCSSLTNISAWFWDYWALKCQESQDRLALVQDFGQGTTKSLFYPSLKRFEETTPFLFENCTTWERTQVVGPRFPCVHHWAKTTCQNGFPQLNSQAVPMLVGQLLKCALLTFCNLTRSALGKCLEIQDRGSFHPEVAIQICRETWWRWEKLDQSPAAACMSLQNTRHRTLRWQHWDCRDAVNTLCSFWALYASEQYSKFSW